MNGRLDLPDVAAIIANYEGAAYLPACLETLAAQTRSPSEIFVVDAGSTDDSRIVAERHGAIFLDRDNNGLGWLYNEGARAARAEYLLLANSDVAFDLRCLERLVDALSDDQSAFAADPRQLDWNGEQTIHARTRLRRGPLLRTLIPGLVVDSNAPPYEGRPISTVCANAGAMLVRRTRFLELGGFDEKFFMDFEDIDICWRAWLRGWGSIYVPDAVVRHKVGGATTPTTPARRITSSHENLTRFALKCLPISAVGRVIIAEMLRFPRSPRPMGRAVVRVAVELPAVLQERRKLRPTKQLFEQLTSL